MSTHAGSASSRPFAKRALTPWTIGAAAVVAVVIAVVAFVIANNGSSSSTSPATASGLKVGVPQIVTVAQLRSFAARVSAPIYWVGPGHATTHLEVTTTTNGDVFVRYLPQSAAAGDPRPIFTTVGTYGLTDAYKVVLHDSLIKGATLVNVPGGGIAVNSTRAPDSYYVAFPRENFVAELFDPSPKYARRLVRSGFLRPVP
jgi:hypothetical protein